MVNGCKWYWMTNLKTLKGSERSFLAPASRTSRKDQDGSAKHVANATAKAIYKNLHNVEQMLCLNILNDPDRPQNSLTSLQVKAAEYRASIFQPLFVLPFSQPGMDFHVSTQPKSQEDYRTWYLHLESEGLLPYADGWPKCLLSAVLLQIFGPKDLLKISKKLPHFNHSLPLTAVICQHAGAPFVPPSQLGCFGPSCNEWIEVQTRRPYKLHHAASTTTCVWFHNNSS